MDGPPDGSNLCEIVGELKQKLVCEDAIAAD
jgi:hypothetical protein